MVRTRRYSADVAGLEREFGRSLTKLPNWAERHAEVLGGIDRVTFQMNVASLPQSKMLRAIDTIGARIVPALHAVNAPLPL